MKGITPVIAVILLLLITIAMVGFAFVFFTRIANTAANATQQQLGSELDRQGKTINIENIDASTSTVTLRNIGTRTILASDIKIYTNGASNNSYSCSSISPGSTADCTRTANGAIEDVCPASTTFRVVAPGNEDSRVC
jgi:flagellin-like protein